MNDRDYRFSEIKKICKNQEYCLSRDYFGKLSSECLIVDICLDIRNWVKRTQPKCGIIKEFNNED